MILLVFLSCKDIKKPPIGCDWRFPIMDGSLSCRKQFNDQ
ncbi:hypothetical protein PARMER_00936 [Parabacteroides merdae ATCC 43184]|nr:hypothetical protein PARMER_00936 [Parabacteroides merdae ATCC 43184]